MRLQNKIILITGGNSGIGFATAEKVIKEGAIAIIVGRDENKIKMACDALGKKARGFTCDITVVDEITKLYENISKQYEIIHGVVANAGSALLEPIESITEKSFDASIQLNLKSAFFTVQKAIPFMKQGGSVVLNASLSAYRTFENGAIYSATKAALVSLSSSMALEYAKYKIRVNSVSPGVISTPFFDKLGMTADEVKRHLLMYRTKMSLERVGKPEEIANVIAFLLSDESSYVTGTNILADGGLANCIK